MSDALDRVLAQSADEVERTVTLSPESVAVLLYATEFLEDIKNWLGKAENPEDQVTNADLDDIERITGNLIEQVLNPVTLNMAYIGEVREFTFYPPPDDWLECMGQEVGREFYADLFAVIGETYGAGNGTTTFLLPDLRMKTVIGVDVTSNLADTGGEQSHTLTAAEIPSHTHQQTVNNTTPQVRFTAGGSVINTASGATSSSSTPLTTQPTGGGEAHNNMPPYIMLIKAIYAGVS